LNNVDYSANDLHPSSATPASLQSKGNTHADHLFLRDRLGASFTAGGWTFEPGLNISYEHVSRRASQNNMSIGSTGMYSTSYSSSMYKQGLIYLTPTVDISYRSLLQIQGGVLEDLSDYHGQKPAHRNYPFAGLSVDLLRLAGGDHASRLQLFGSYAKTAPGTGGDYPLTDLSGNNDVFASFPQTGFIGVTYYPYGPGPVYFAGQPQSNFWIWEAGARFALPGDRFSVSYNFERRNFITLALIPVPQGSNGTGYVYAYPEWKSSLHRLGIQWKVFDGKGLRWQTGLNATILKSKANIVSGEIFVPPMGNYNTDQPSYTGGWVNRLEWKDFLAGADLVYHFKEQVLLDLATGSTERVNSFQLQHVYAGYRLHLAKDRPLELYFDSRSPYQNSRSTLADKRRYYGVGGKLSI
jgi:hypothetical protein